LVVASRLLKFSILNPDKKFKNHRERSYPRAHLCIEVGGYMREEAEKEGRRGER
jgi:hypothetical protein